MNQYAILTAIGSDRPGLVDEVSRFVFERGGNIEDSRMLNLRGQFAIMMLVAGDEPTLRRIGAELSALQDGARLRAELHPAEPGRPASAEGAPYRLIATALDQAGLVHRIAHLLRSLNVNIESLQTRLRAAPISGAPTFEMDLAITVPPDAPLEKLRQESGRLCDDLNIDWRLSAL